MRKLLIPLLLAGAAATPALADPGDHSDRNQARAEHQQARAERQQARAEQRQERSNNAERPQMRMERQERAAPDRPQFSGRQGFNGAAAGGNQQAFDRARFQQEMQDNQQGDNSRAERRAARQQAFEGRRVNAGETPLRQPDRALPGVMRPRDRSGVVRDIPRRGTQPPLVQNHRRDNVRWDHNWRRDHRYDWRSWRNQHRSIFHLGFYYDPFGWGYQPFSIGWRLWPNYYSSNYWINDPWQYRLPYAPPGTVWIRYYNDALLVDTYTGQVVDAIRGFFW